MLVCEYITQFLVEKGIHHVFGYPGGMVTYLMDAFAAMNGRMGSHLTYHEQGAAFAACGYGMLGGELGVAYATSGPGATNLVTGIADAYFDSIPTLFFTGQVNTRDCIDAEGPRQKGFQETDVVRIVKPITKYAVSITDAVKIPQELEKAYRIAMTGRPGPVVLDIPIDVQRTEVPVSALEDFEHCYAQGDENAAGVYERFQEEISHAKRPVVLVGAGLRQAGARRMFRQWIEKVQIPVVTSMVAVDALPSDHPQKVGFLGAYGDRWANFAVEKCDFLLVLGARLDGRQTGPRTEQFAPNAKIFRVDIDAGELSRKVHPQEISVQVGLREFLEEGCCQPLGNVNWTAWINVCHEMKEQLKHLDNSPEREIIHTISQWLPSDAVVTTDVGQNQVWIAQAFDVKDQVLLFSGGHGAMGFSLPAAIGACYRTGRPVYAFMGDGGFQMNLQELQTVVRDQLPIQIFVLNNHSLGMIRHFQEMYFDKRYVQTVASGGYTVPNFSRIAEAYGIEAMNVQDISDMQTVLQNPSKPHLFNILLRDQTYVFPKLAMGKPICDQDPLMDRDLWKYLQEL